MRHFLALYVGGMGSRKQNFYNQLVQRYGFEDAARTVQDLYLEGRKDEAAAALPAELIDAVSLVGPRDVVRDRLAVFRDAGVGHAHGLPHGLDVRRPARPAPRGGRPGGMSLPGGPGVAPGRPRRRARARRADRRLRRDATATFAPPGWEPPPPGRELERWRGRITDGSWWTRVAEEPGGRIVGARLLHPGRRSSAADGTRTLEPVPGRAHVSAVFTHPDRWREGVADGDAGRTRRTRCAPPATPRSSSGRPEQAPARRFYEATGWTHDGRRQWLAEIAMPIVAYVKAL